MKGDFIKMENEKITNLDLKTFKSMSNDQLIALSKVIRSFLIKSISKTGGHIGANLGTMLFRLLVMGLFVRVWLWKL